MQRKENQCAKRGIHQNRKVRLEKPGDRESKVKHLAIVCDKWEILCTKKKKNEFK
ncbi:hypothetical protein DPMN_137272 [Dreissena polymorpha]|uniref:Uncharacterized protein n=1 Tax=Dreissena polymorpha TaxID=45954 RepID=A0A9D4JIN6_DREPO|nr:hypothetical protein DPMN_137272 [Dreissena polymorpha]